MAKIMGNIVGLPSPRSDWNQTDEMKADFIKNKPVEAINAALSLKYYGDANIFPSDDSLFRINEISSEECEISETTTAVPEELVIPYQLTKDGKVYKVTKIIDGGFQLAGAKHIIIPNTITSIGSTAFYMSDIETITIPKSVKSIGRFAFTDAHLKEVYYEGSKSEWDAVEVNYEDNSELKNATIHYGYSEVTKEYVDEKLEEVKASVGGDSEDKLKLLHYYGDVNIVPASSGLFNVGTNGTIWSEGPAQDVTGVLVVPYECTTGGKVYEAVMVGEEGLSGVKANKVILPSSIKMIGAGCFYGSEALKELVICGKSFRVDEAAFEECQNFKDIYYRGTKSDWDTKVQGKNYIPSTVTIHYIGI